MVGARPRRRTSIAPWSVGSTRMERPAGQEHVCMYVNHIHTTDRTDRGTRKLQCKPGLPSGSYNAPRSLSGSCS